VEQEEVLQVVLVLREVAVEAVAVLMVAQVLRVVTAVMYLLEQAEMALVRQEETVVTEAKPYSTVVVTQKAPIVSKQRTKTNQVTKRRDKDPVI